MKKILPKIIYFFIMPCSKATLRMERDHAGELSWIKKLRLKLHLSVCDFCVRYYKKLETLDRLMTESQKNEKIQKFKPTEIQLFIEKIKNKIKK
ncbi:hypothetical protein [Riemerella columbipharyngis]|uniref:Zinc-finger n=1 Tax=Riemerella columbipharyngis TaxID=1071918 RepID=A0A1G7BZS4_9FLAO|nr:hypothetical protein [Riemerella columbipharyngis]SDE32547.1 hypothetical protein SAMN05421544_1079 [Riemerella columbipharyngis]